jgi:hypothetical protein
MRTARNICFIVLCVALLHTYSATLRAGCWVPGLVGLGETEYQAELDCYYDALEDCQDLCETYCGTSVWTDYDCNVIGGGPPYSAVGSCGCGYNPN